MTKPWSGRVVEQARTYMARTLPTPCGRCGRTVTQRDRWVVGHIRSRAAYPELTHQPRNWQIECDPCSRSSAQLAVQEKAAVDALRTAGIDPNTLDFSRTTPPGQPPLLPFSPSGGQPEPFVIPEGMSWPEFVRAAPGWLLPWLEVDENSSPPLVVSPLHPAAVGTYAEQAVPWVEEVEGKRLRWWQRLGFALKLQHDAEGRLLKRDVTETAPRRAGKSVGLRGLALWRMEHGGELFGERQEIVHTGFDLAVCRKAQKEAWRWARAQWGPRAVTEGNGKEEVKRLIDDSVWLVRAQTSTYGWDTTLALVDEGWDVEPATVSEGLEPSLMGRQSPQLVKTSTSHRKAKSTMRTALAAGLAGVDPKVLVLWWGALPTDDPGAPETWRKASPYWDEERREFVASMYAKALAGEEDPELDDPDPMRGFCCQFLNVWDLKERRTVGNPLVSSADWGRLVAAVPDAPAVVAVEGWPGEGISVARAWAVGDVVVVSVADFPDVAAAAAAVKGWGRRAGAVLVGSSLAGDPAWAGVRVTATSSPTRAAVADLARMLGEGLLRHDGGQHLTGQVLELRTSPSVDGLRLRSTGRADAVKAAAWAVAAARRPSLGRPRILLPSAAS